MTAVDVAVRLLPALALVVGAPLAVLWWARRHRQGPARRLQVLERAGLGRHVAVAVVGVGRRRFLVGAGEHGVSLLGELDPEPEPDDRLPVPAAASPPQAYPAGQDAPADARPGTGLIRRLQRMTLRTAGPPRARR